MLSFTELRAANLARLPGAIDEGWNLAEWGCALAGETGELCNVLKKHVRQMEGDPDRAELRGMAAEELADVLIYADLIAAKLEIDLGEWVKYKFNKDSLKRGLPQRL